jgi:CHAT domain-containing protein
VSVRLWREGKVLTERLPAGQLGVVVDKRPVAEALAAWRKRASESLTLGRGKEWQPLPGTRLEARALAALVPQTMALLGSEASQQKLSELAAANRLKEYRLLHLATHGQANPARPRLTALILAQDHLDDTAAATRAALAGKRPVDGRLTVGTVLKSWHLDADLVVLSACQTGLGTEAGSEGMLGFTQALLQKGARSVVLSRWKVDDAATALLMTRFYENVLGKRKDTKPLGRAAALAEAKAWLRNLSRAEATKRLAALVGGVPRGERGSIKAALPTRKPGVPKGEDRPFAAPYYWAAFVLIGDPN